MLGQRRRRWPNIKTSLFQRVVFAGMAIQHTGILCGMIILLSHLMAGDGRQFNHYSAEILFNLKSS